MHVFSIIQLSKYQLIEVECTVLVKIHYYSVDEQLHNCKSSDHFFFEYKIFKKMNDLNRLGVKYSRKYLNTNTNTFQIAKYKYKYKYNFFHCI